MPSIDITKEFKVRKPSIQNCPAMNSSPIEFFYLFCTNVVWNLLVNEMNKYTAKQIKNKSDFGLMKKYSRLKKWVDVSVSEIKKIISVMINMGLTCRKKCC